MKRLYVVLVLVLFLVVGCVRKDVHPAKPDIGEEVECDALTLCSGGYECVKLPDKDKPLCIKSDVLKSAYYKDCVVLESYPVQLKCPEGKTPTIKECEVDFDCKIGGCNGEICAKKEFTEEIASICVYRPEFGCYKLTNCKCLNDKCGWDQTEEFLDCLSKY